jgi:hypothetical protein
MSNRLEIRLDAERRRKVEELAESRQTSISDLVRDLLDHAYDEWLKVERHRAVERLASLNIEDVPDPEELARQFDEAYEFPLR